jgi:hypothetical protein
VISGFSTDNSPREALLIYKESKSNLGVTCATVSDLLVAPPTTANTKQNMKINIVSNKVQNSSEQSNDFIGFFYTFSLILSESVRRIAEFHVN